MPSVLGAIRGADVHFFHEHVIAAEQVQIPETGLAQQTPLISTSFESRMKMFRGRFTAIRDLPVRRARLPNCVQNGLPPPQSSLRR